MTEKLVETPSSEPFRFDLGEHGFVEVSHKSIGGEGLAELRRYAAQNGYEYVSGTKTVFKIVDDDFQKEPVVCMYDPNKIEKKEISYDEQDDDKKSYSASRIAEFSSLGFPVLHSSRLRETIWFEPLNRREELEEQTA